MTQANNGDERQEIKALASESSWLQKALFALNKVQTAREAQADAKGKKDYEPLVFKVGKNKVKLEDLMEAMSEHATAVLEEASERRLALR